MSIKLLIIFCCIIKITASGNRYCVVNYNDPGIHVVEEKKCGKDDHFEKSSFYRNEIKNLNLTISEWAFYDSTKNFSLAHTLVLDQRWELFLNNHDEVRILQNFINMAIGVDIFWSVKLCGIVDNNTSKDKWLHLKQPKNNSNNHFLKCDIKSNCSDFNNSSKFELTDMRLWKLHHYVYSYTTENNSQVEIMNLKNNTDCPKIDEGCFTFYLAMCKECSIQLKWNDNKTLMTIQGTGEWKTVGVTLHDFSNCSTVTLTTHTTASTSEPFWAVGDKGYLSSNGSCETLKRYINATENNTYCENSYNERIPYRNKIITENEKLQAEAFFSNNLYLPFIIVIFLMIIGAAAFGWIKYRKDTSHQDTEDLHLIDRNAMDEVKTAYGNETRVPKDWPPIKSSEFSKYVREIFDSNQQNNILEQQFQDLPSGYLKPATEGKKIENLAKNRFKDIVPYDENRVILKYETSRSKMSDYINASYIDSTNNLREYIITQNPLENTITDFLQMIWQENVQYIVMISIPNEKFHCYWPNEKKIIAYKGLNLDVSLERLNSYEFHDHRVLRFEKGGEVREINHLHFHSWSPDDLSSHIFVEFMDHLLSIPHNNSPVVFHCLAGVGRSGTIILCDMTLRSAPATSSYNLFEITKHLRHNRANMVSNLKQYQLAHLIVYETLNFTDSSTEVDDQFAETFGRVFEGNSLKSLWTNYLEDKEWLQKAIISYDIYPKNSPGNRYKNNTNLLPVERCRVLLEGRESDYIHAMYVDGFRKEKSFIVAQQPLANTIDEFWLMILQQNVKIIINVHEIDVATQGDVQYFPTIHSRTMKRSDITVYLKDEEENLHYSKSILRVYYRGKNPICVFLYSIKKWAKIKSIPDSTDSLISLWNDINLGKSVNFPIVICCDDGITSSSLVACFFYMAKKMIQLRKCDIVGSVRSTRRTHYNFITFEQFVFLHNCALAFYENCFNH